MQMTVLSSYLLLYFCTETEKEIVKLNAYLTHTLTNKTVNYVTLQIVS